MKKKLNKQNLVMIIIFLLSLTLIISDFLVMTVGTLLGKNPAWSWFGFVTFMAAGIFLDWSISYLKEVLDTKKENHKAN